MPGPAVDYFRSVQAKVNEAWDPNASLKAHDPKGKRFGTRDRYTILDVTLDAAGTIAAIQIHRSSGLAFLDDAAVEAFRRAAPFGPPPPEVLRDEGTVVFPFGFYMDAAASPPRCRPREKQRAER